LVVFVKGVHRYPPNHHLEVYAMNAPTTKGKALD